MKSAARPTLEATLASPDDGARVALDVQRPRAALSELRSLKPAGPLRLHLGCGEQRLADYVNVDYPPAEHTVQQRPAADVYADITQMRLPPASVDEVRLHHVFEHFDRATALALLCEWHWWLRPGGKLLIETPDLEACVGLLKSPQSTFEEKQAVVRHLFGSHEAPWAVHQDGWDEARFRRVLGALGFGNLRFEHSQWKMFRNITVHAEKTATSTVADMRQRTAELLHASLVDESESELRLWAVWRDKIEKHLGTLAPDDSAPPRSDITRGPDVTLGVANAKLPLKTAPAVSIFMPAYNRERYLAATFDSLLAQTWRDFELIIADDGSTDGTLAIAREYASRDARVRVLALPHRGEVETRNDAIRHTHPASRYLLNHDSDDLSLPDKLARLVAHLETHPECAIVGCVAEYFNDAGRHLGRPPIEHEPDRVRATFGEVNSMINSAALIRREVFAAIGGYREEFRSVDDYDFFARALLAGFQLANLPEVLHKIRLHPQSVGSTRAQAQEKLAQEIRANYRRQSTVVAPAARPVASRKPLNILHTVEFYAPHVGGAELVVQKISEQLVRRGHRVTVATQQLAERQCRELNGVRIEEFAVNGKMATGIHGEAARYQQFLRDFPADVMMNYAAQQWATDLAFDGVSAGTPRRANIIAPCGYSALLDPQTLRWPEFGDYFRKTLPAVLPRYDAAVYHSALYKDFTYGQRLGLANGVVIPNGCEAAEFLQPPAVDFRAKFQVGTRHIALCVANFYPGKGHQRVVECFRAMNRPDTTLVLVGKHGEELPRLRELARGLDVRFLVDVSRADTVAAFQAADLFLFGSEIEASPLVIIEAKASRTPFISTDCGNVREWKGGIVCAPEEMASHANRLLGDKSEHDRLATEGWQEWKERLTWDAVVDQWEEFYLRMHRAKCGASSTTSVSQPATTQGSARPIHKQGLVVVKLQGGMGNQMFEYAAGLALARRHNARLVLDLSFLRDRTPRPNFTYRDYDLDIFKLVPDCEVEDDASGLKNNLRVFGQKYFHYDPEFASLPADVYLDGYWQSPRYFDGVEDEICESFRFAQPLTGEQSALCKQIASAPAVCLNVRRADFVANPEATAFHGYCDDAYFRAASALVARRVPRGRFFIFSDDPAWCASVNLTDGRESVLVGHEHKGDRFAAYLQLMAACRHFVLPNSSFGWWAAFLSAATDKLVVVPEPWFNDVETNMDDMLPSGWYRLSKSWN
ncbi:MAG: glycosyltransferase [Verrucomicrobia bacterium]|nr:glycosyltransferase [Verrucomicrobiota bacterium]